MLPSEPVSSLTQRMELAIILGVICLVVSSHALTVRGKDLQRCDGDQHVCVTDKVHCNPLPDNMTARTQVKLTCYFEESDGLLDQVSCDWSPTSSGSSLVFTKWGKPVECNTILWYFGNVNVTVKIHDWQEGVVRWSNPHNLNLTRIVRPVVVLSGSSSSSLNLSWIFKNQGVCQVRYAAKSGPTTTKEVNVKSGRQFYTLQELLPSTLYSTTVACKPRSNSWSLWSAEVKGRTLERVPSAAPDVCYRLEPPGAPPLFLLWLLWTELDVYEAGGRIQGYQVSIYSTNELQQAQATINVTQLTALLQVEEYCRVTVTAFNSVGFGPMRSLDIKPHQPLPSPRHLWAISLFPDRMGFLVQWEMDSFPYAPPTALGPPGNQGASSPPLPVSKFAVEWRTVGRDSVSSWTTVYNTSATIQGDLDPEQIYNITVHPVHAPLCGPARSLTASLKHGALLDVVNLKAEVKNTTMVTAQWTWRNKTEPIRVERYKVVLRCNSEEQALLLLPDQSQHTFQNLTPNKEYFLLLLADNITRETFKFRTDSGAITWQQAPLVSIVIVLVMFFCFLSASRVVYKYYLFPTVPSPRRSSTGIWLMDKHRQVSVRNIPNAEDFLVTDVLGAKHPYTNIEVCVGAQLYLETSQCTNFHPAGLGQLVPSQEYMANAQFVGMAAVFANDGHDLDTITNSPVTVEALSEKMQFLVLPPHHHSRPFPQNEEVTSQLSRFHTPEIFNLCFRKGLDCPGDPPMVCQSDYVLSSNLTETSPAESSCIHVTGTEVR